MMEIYMTMLSKMVETGNAMYYLVNYDEYLRLVFSNPVTGFLYISMAVIFVLYLVIAIPMITICVKSIKGFVKELKTIE